MKTKYRIIQLWNGYYQCQKKYWFYPFWIEISIKRDWFWSDNVFVSIEEAQKAIEYVSTSKKVKWQSK